jgi:REP element-mobilizing transposase RayT
MAFIDMDLGEAKVAAIGRALRRINLDLELVLIASDDNRPRLSELQPWKLLRKPFYLPDLLIMLGEEVPTNHLAPANNPTPTVPAPTDDESDALPWLKDVNKAAQHLTRMTLESSAQAALIARQNELWAYAGQLSQPAARELTFIVARDHKENDLLRFVRLDATRAEHMLYATRLMQGVTLALVFDAETPFSTIRSQANNLAQSLAVLRTGLTGQVRAQVEPVRPVQAQVPVTDSQPVDLHNEISGDSEEIDVPPISAILQDVPSPNPEPVRPQAVMSQPDPYAAEDREMRDSFSAETRASSTPVPASFSRESSPVVRLGVDTQNPPENPVESMPDLDVTMPSRTQRPETPIRRPEPGQLDETLPHTFSEVAAGRLALEPITAGLYNLTYACLLVPRFSTHYLTGDLADRLSEWLPQVCVAFGWRLEFLAVRPEYLQWVVNVPPSTSPGYLMRIMRQQTSEKIFHDFTRLKKENPSGDFWAPGYLIMGGAQPHPQQLVKDYIRQTRQRQGQEIASRPRH